MKHSVASILLLISGLCALPACSARTVALWLFDEQVGLYPSCVLGDAASGRFPLVIGLGGQIAPGKFGNALHPKSRPPVEYPPPPNYDNPATKGQFGLIASGRDERMSWQSANFCALMTSAERHLRQEVGFANPTETPLNLGQGDWTVEFWYRPSRTSDAPGTVFELGTGPRGGKGLVTRLSLDPNESALVLVNDANDVRVQIPTTETLFSASSPWRHVALVYDAQERQLRHYVDGKSQPQPPKSPLRPLPVSQDAYMSIGRDGTWNHPLPGLIDELRISDSQAYAAEFEPPASFSDYATDYEPPPLHRGPPLLFAGKEDSAEPVQLGSRKHLFLDDALLAFRENVTFSVNPPRLAELVMEGRGLSNHLVVFEDVASGDGLIRLYARGPQNSLAVWTSVDGVHFTPPDLGRSYRGAHNVVIEDPVGLGTVFADPNAPEEQRIKYFSGYRGRGMYVYSSPDGYAFTRNETSALPLRAASQSIVFYDDQRGRYVGYHRSDMERTPGGKSSRTFVMSETSDLMRPWPFTPVSQAEQSELAALRPLGEKNPYYIDNGPLTPPGFGVEFPRVFGANEGLDPVGVDVYVPKCIKYAWAEDAYVAFPVIYFHYQGDGPQARRALGQEEAGLGSGPLESQLATSRDGIRWQPYPRPAYVGIGRHAGLDLKKAYMGHGLIRRGDEIWQYYVGSEKYHSPWSKDSSQREAVFRTVQRIDGFVSLDSPYTGGTIRTKPLVFDGNRLVLNLDTDAAGYAQIGLLDEQGKAIEGFEVEQCVFINGDFTSVEVEWLTRGKDLSDLAGRVVQIELRSRGTKLYSLQFAER